MIGDRVSLRYQFLLGLRSNRTALFDRGWSADNKMSWQLPRGDKEEIFFSVSGLTAGEKKKEYVSFRFKRYFTQARIQPLDIVPSIWVSFCLVVDAWSLACCARGLLFWVFPLMDNALLFGALGPSVHSCLVTCKLLLLCEFFMQGWIIIWVGLLGLG